jgi:hypothetical protein
MSQISAKTVNADSQGSYLVNYLVVLWLEGRSCSRSCWLQTWCIGTACMWRQRKEALYVCGTYSFLSDVLTKEVGALDPLHYSPVNVDGESVTCHPQSTPLSC